MEQQNQSVLVSKPKANSTKVATDVDEICSDGKQVTINKDGEPVLKRLKSPPEPKEVEELESKIRELMPERSILDILWNVEHWLNWTRHLGHDPIEQEKRFKYLDLVASAVILHNTVDMSLAIQTLMARGEPVHQRYIKALSPFITRHIKRYGDYIVNLHIFPQPLEAAINLPPEIFEI